MNSSLLRSFPGTTPFGTGRFDPSPSIAQRLKPRRTVKRSRLGRALLLQMLISGTAANTSSDTERRQDVVTRSAVVYEEEQSPTVRSPLLNGVGDDWSTDPASQDWDGRELAGGSQNLPAIAGLLAVAGAGYFCTRAVGALFSHRSDLARIVPHPVSFSATTSTADAASPRSSLSDDGLLRSRPLSPGLLETLRTEDRGTSPIPQEGGIDRSTSMGSLVKINSVRDAGAQTTDIEDDAVSMTSAADAIEVESTVSSVESSDLGSLDLRDTFAENRGLQSDHPRFRPLTPELIQELPKEYTIGTLRERAQLAMRAATAATEAAQRASAFSAAASTASAVASKASNQAMAAATLAHIALESGNIDQMTHAQTEAWKAVQIAAESENRAAEAAALATAYEDLSEQQAKVARELSRPPPESILKTTGRRISAFFHPITAAVTGMTSAVTRWCIAVWTYFSSGTCWQQICSFCSSSVAFVNGILLSLFTGIKDAILYIFSKVTGFCSYVGEGMKHGFDSCARFFKVLYTRIFNPRGSIGGEATA